MSESFSPPSHHLTIWFCWAKILKMKTEPGKRGTNLVSCTWGPGVPSTAPLERWRGCALISIFSTIVTSLAYFYVLLLWGKVPIHYLVVQCLCFQQLWPCVIPQSWTWTLLKMQWNSIEMLSLFFHSVGCHLNASPNKPRPETCQLPLISRLASGRPHTTPQE